MSDHLLPDEIISEILSPALKVSDEVFSDTSDISPFANYSESTSAYLLVCKSWLRVATPLLYNVVILRSKAQAKALSLTLSANQQLGQFVKKLRVEGGYGPPMGIILDYSPNISDIFVSLDIYAADNTSGLCKGLSLINPTRLILRENKRLENKMVSQLIDALKESMSKWDRLCVFDCPYIDGSDRAIIFAQPLANSKRLHTLTILKAGALPWAYSVFKECPLQAIHIKRSLWAWERLCAPFDKDPALKALLKFTEKPSAITKAEDPIVELPLIAPSLNPSFIPMAGAPKEVHDAVWARILYFALSVPELEDNTAPRNVPQRITLLLVSKTFNRLGLPYYYAHVLLRGSSKMSNFASVLKKYPSIAPRVRSLLPVTEDFVADDESDDDDSLQSDSMVAVLSQTSGLVRIGHRVSLVSPSYSVQFEAPISWDAFEVLAKCSGATLRDCSVRIGRREDASAAVFNDLTALRALYWKSYAGFVTSTNAAPDGLANMEDLRISKTSPSFVTVLSLMKLKSLRRVVFSTDVTHPEMFLNAHGAKLIELNLPYGTIENLSVKIFDLCPNLISVSFAMRPDWKIEYSPYAPDFHAHQVVPSLVKIILDAPYWTRKKDQIIEWEQFFVDFESQTFPNLREIQVKCCAWPTTEREIAKSDWVRWAEILLRKNVSLTDKSGKNWRPRLKVK
ncbi:hypothetical protein B0H13DRAFT_1716676 [Mycena leptocephala]|nr:hypothetical protein B0H13DRAFT_1716676 [Mycena leptocephala]